MEFQTPFNIFVDDAESNDGKSVTETAGYVPAKQQIENLILAGERLADYRREQYDFGHDEDVPEDFEDPTRSPNFDLADYSAYARQVNAKLAEAKRKASQGSTEPKADTKEADPKKETERPSGSDPEA